MATHISAEKRHRQSLRRRSRNRLIKGAVRTAAKDVRVAYEKKDPELKEILRRAERTIAKAAAKGVLDKKAASRSISRLASLVASAR